ncbi:hypothetical protein E2562_002262 [Oryza meyeriana var. granulata]|uniref:Uncharacterized protein n=1 Tax=Oryza meyeriana var. granulata TaxID=110450 RepID=A0A6G1BJE3_9ORYZ|nr:hypothetical protein E2562_002262 [Oryza meyeriana var. granulata]
MSHTRSMPIPAVGQQSPAREAEGNGEEVRGEKRDMEVAGVAGDSLALHTSDLAATVAASVRRWSKEEDRGR